MMKQVYVITTLFLIGVITSGMIDQSYCWEESMNPSQSSDFTCSLNSSMFWEGLGPQGATVENITFHPVVDGLVYLGTFEEGLYYSRDDGMNWTQVYPDQAPIHSVLIDPFDPSTVLVGAETYFFSPGYLRRSSNWGQTWIESFSGRNVMDCVFDPSRPGVAYMSIMGDDDHTPAEFYRSTNGGESWTLMNPGGTYKGNLFVWGFFELLVSPVDGSIMAFTLWTTGMGQMENHVCLSTDGGASWDYLDTGLYDSHAYDMEWIFPRIIVAGTKDGLYLNRYGGEHWVRIPNEMAGSNCFELEPGPTDNILYLVEKQLDRTEEEPYMLHRSTDWGFSWSSLNYVDDPCEIITVAADPHDSPGTETILTGTWESGVFASTDLGSTWEMRNEGLPPLPCSSLEFGPPGSDLLYAGTWSFFQAGLYRSRDMGMTWERANDGLPSGIIGPICPHPTNEDIVYAASKPKGIYKSTDQGDSWIRLKDGLPEHGYTFSLTINPSDPEILFAGTEYGLYRSSDSGDSWFYSGNGIERPDIRDVDLDPLDPNHMFAAVYVDGIYESLDGGDNWNRVLEETQWKDFSSIAVAPGGERVFAGMSFTNQLFRTTDGGDNWETTLSQVAETIVVPEDNPLVVICGGYQTGVWISVNGGDDWFTLPGGLEGADIEDLALPPSEDELLYAATTLGIQHLTSGSAGRE